MNTKWEIRVALILIIILVSISLGGCSVPQIQSAVEESNTQAEHTQDHDSSSIPNFQGIADALGCVFSPDSCGK